MPDPPCEIAGGAPPGGKEHPRRPPVQAGAGSGDAPAVVLGYGYTPAGVEQLADDFTRIAELLSKDHFYDDPEAGWLREIAADPAKRHAITAVRGITSISGKGSNLISAVKMFLRSIPPGCGLPTRERMHDALFATFDRPVVTRLRDLAPSSRITYSDNCARFFEYMYDIKPGRRIAKRDVRKRGAADGDPATKVRWRLSIDLLRHMLEDDTADPGYKAVLAFSWDTVARIGEVLHYPGAGRTKRYTPFSALNLTRPGAGIRMVNLQAWTKTGSNYTTISAMSEGPQAHPSSLDSYKYVTDYLSSRPACADDDHLWVDRRGKAISSAKFNKFLRQYVEPQVKPHVSGHCIRISSACHLYMNHVDPDFIMELARWESRSAFHDYVRNTVKPLLGSVIEAPL
jgi:hypothetical protein